MNIIVSILLLLYSLVVLYFVIGGFTKPPQISFVGGVVKFIVLYIVVFFKLPALIVRGIREYGNR